VVFNGSDLDHVLETLRNWPNHNLLKHWAEPPRKERKKLFSNKLSYERYISREGRSGFPTKSDGGDGMDNEMTEK
jgi:hypothetical protein